jgi:hypothetical protein
MMKQTTLAAVFVLGAAATASAGGKEGTIGVGAEFGLNEQTGGISLNYDGGKFHFGGFLAYSDADGENNTDFTLGGRFYYHIASTAMSDFGIGGGIGYLSHDTVDGMGNSDRKDLMFLEPGFQIRVFLASNVVHGRHLDRPARRRRHDPRRPDRAERHRRRPLLLLLAIPRRRRPPRRSRRPAP